MPEAAGAPAAGGDAGALAAGDDAAATTGLVTAAGDVPTVALLATTLETGEAALAVGGDVGPAAGGEVDVADWHAAKSSTIGIASSARRRGNGIRIPSKVLLRRARCRSRRLTA